MAIKREQEVTINLKDGTSLTLNGDAAHSTIAALENYRVGSLNGRKGFSYTDENDQITTLLFNCICGWTVGPTTETEIPDRECDPMECLPD